MVPFTEGNEHTERYSGTPPTDTRQRRHVDGLQILAKDRLSSLVDSRISAVSPELIFSQVRHDHGERLQAFP